MARGEAAGDSREESIGQGRVTYDDKCMLKACRDSENNHNSCRIRDGLTGGRADGLSRFEWTLCVGERRTKTRDISRSLLNPVIRSIPRSWFLITRIWIRPLQNNCIIITLRNSCQRCCKIRCRFLRSKLRACGEFCVAALVAGKETDRSPEPTGAAAT